MLHKPVAVVGGAGSTLGIELCQLLSENNYEVIALARSQSLHQQVEVLECDLTDVSQVEGAFQKISQSHGPVSTYIHNLGDFSQSAFLESDAESFERLWQVNCLSAYHAVKAVLPDMLKNGGGEIIFIGATASMKGNAGFSAFASAKFALRGLAQSLAREFAPQGVHVAHLVIDGVMWGERAKSWGMTMEQCIKPKAVAETVLHLVQQDNSAWTFELDLRPDIENF
jgi:NAD(P)-dependent dehydrogenase (short-subunit alcohol dehydrogenase family)